MNTSDYFRALQAGRVTIVVDDPAAASPWLDLGEVTTLAAYDLLREHDRPALVVASRLETVGRLHETWEDSPCEFTYLSLARHDPSEAAARHAAALLRALDGPAALTLRAERYDALLSSDVLEVAGSLRVRLGGELEIANMSDEVRPHWLQSTTEFLEASIVNLERDGSSFTADGVFAFAGLAYLCNSADVHGRHGDALRRLLRAAAGGDNRLELADNRVERVVVGGVDVTAAFSALFADDERGATVLELGLGCAGLAPDWTIDSPLHKGSRGLFLGVGTGHRGPHVDFVAPEASVRFQEPPAA
ncbi:hypothetical protein [Nannocystis punicea]|uniref:Crocagin biosynthetic protein CgnE/B domain-containing protein n=1 Tax=Nannocystis punicea TaxID=2995304 RepID=A0ABY7GXG5_9BACT|nr:hypothetical protein [Nannocystis poenicansa]WAS91509.1 hypothetical protein O0S08_35450 [Nannocystis poenicansa]